MRPQGLEPVPDGKNSQAILEAVNGKSLGLSFERLDTKEKKSRGVDIGAESGRLLERYRE